MQRNSRSRQHHAEVDTEGSWAISYGDMVTLLLTFFIMFFAADKFIREKTHIQLDLKPVTERFDHNVSTQEDTATYPSKEALEKLKGKVYKVGNRLVVEFSGVTFFDSGEIGLNKNGSTALAGFYKMYQPFAGTYQLGIRSFTDTRKVQQKPGRRFHDNLELSALRSIAVMRQLRDHGVPLTAMKLSGYGEMAITMKALEALPESKRKPTSIDDLARTVILVIEPKEEP